MFASRTPGAFINSDGFYNLGAAFGPVTAFDPTHPALGTSGRGNGKHFGGDDLFSGRAKLLFQPSDDLSIQLTYETLDDDSDSPPVANGTPADLPDPNPGTPANELGLVWNALGLTADPGNPIKHAATTQRDSLLLNMSRGHRVRVNGYYMNADWTFGDFTLHSVTGFRDQESRLPSTYTGEVGPNSLFDATRDDNRETFQQEIRLNTSFELPGKMTGDAVAGFFYQKDDTDFCVLQVLGFLDLLGVGTSTSTLLTGAADPTFFDNNPQVLCNKQRAHNWALFFDTTINLTDKLSLAGGFRWTSEHKRWAGRNQVFIQFLPNQAVFDPSFTWQDLRKPLNALDFKRFPDGVVRDHHSWGEPTGRVTLSYDVAEGVFTYLSYAHGFKSGAYNDQTGTSGAPITAASAAPTDPEIADSGELGVKLDLLDKRLRLNLAGFYVRYKDAQRDIVATFTNPFGGTFQETRFFNAAEVRAGGIEAELDALITDWLELRSNFGWIDSKYTRFQADTNFDGIVDVDFSNRKVNRSIPFQSGGELVAHHALWTGEMQYSIGVDYEAKAPFVYSNVTSRYDGVTDQRTLLNASITFTDAEDRYFVRLYGHNLTNKVYRVGELPVANLWTMSYYGEPRAWGLELGFKLRSE
jgi:iron complex outermembrane receptor protein